MNRERKYRGKRMDNSDWVEGDLCQQDAENFALIGVWYKPTRECKWIPVWEETVGQYTGLKDKNGREIYEGDVLQCYMNGFPIGAKEIVEFKNGGFVLRYRAILLYQWLFLSEDAEYDYEIIGNIYEKE